jgi:hypothetical protein
MVRPQWWCRRKVVPPENRIVRKLQSMVTTPRSRGAVRCWAGHGPLRAGYQWIDAGLSRRQLGQQLPRPPVRAAQSLRPCVPGGVLGLPGSLRANSPLRQSRSVAGPGLPDAGSTLHAVPADQQVLHDVVHGTAHVQGASERVCRARGGEVVSARSATAEVEWSWRAVAASCHCLRGCASSACRHPRGRHGGRRKSNC